MFSVVIPTIPERKDNLEKLKSKLGGQEVITVYQENLSLSEKRNYGLALASNDWIYFLDDDNMVTSETLVDLAMVMKNSPNVGIAASLAVNDGDVVDGGAWRWLLTGITKSVWGKDQLADQIYSQPYEVDEVANAFCVRREVFKQIGGFDTQRFPIDMDEADLCLRARLKGWSVVYVPSSRVIHPKVPYRPGFRRESNAYYQGRNKILFQRKHLKWWAYLVYVLFFMPPWLAGYTYYLLRARQVRHWLVFLRGVWDGLCNRLDGGQGFQGKR